MPKGIGYGRKKKPRHKSKVKENIWGGMLIRRGLKRTIRRKKIRGGPSQRKTPKRRKL